MRIILNCLQYTSAPPADEGAFGWFRRVGCAIVGVRAMLVIAPGAVSQGDDEHRPYEME